MKKNYMKTKTSNLYRLVVFMLTLGSMLNGQSYFSALLTEPAAAGNSRDMALAGANTSEFSGAVNTFNNPANQSAFSGLELSGGFFAVGMNESRSYRAIDQFGDRVTDNIYVVSQGSQKAFSGGVSWGTGRLGMSLASQPYATPTFHYKEEIRGNLSSSNIVRDPLVGYHHVDQTGVIQGTGGSIGTAFGSWSVGLGLRFLHGIGLENKYGVSVIDSADISALASSVTFFNSETWSLDNTPLVTSLGLFKDFGLHWRFSASYQTGVTIESTRQGAIPMYDSTMFYPLVSWASDTMRIATDIPARLEIGLRMKPSNPLPTSVYVSLAYQDWSKYELSYLDSLADGTSSFNFPLHESFTISGGIEHWVTDQVPFRAGFSWMESPIAGELAQSRFSAGSGWVNGPLRFDVAMQIASIQYSFEDIFAPVGLAANDREYVRETKTKYSISVSYSL